MPVLYRLELSATGRQPLTDDIGLHTVGLPPGSGLEVDDTCMVRALEDGWLYTLGDLTHQGKRQARIAGAAIAARAAGQLIDPARGARTRSPPTTTRCRGYCSATRRQARSA